MVVICTLFMVRFDKLSLFITDYGNYCKFAGIDKLSNFLHSPILRGSDTREEDRSKIVKLEQLLMD